MVPAILQVASRDSRGPKTWIEVVVVLGGKVRRRGDTRANSSTQTKTKSADGAGSPASTRHIQFAAMSLSLRRRVPCVSKLVARALHVGSPAGSSSAAPAPAQVTKTPEVEEDDKSFFKRLGKAPNRFWSQNAEQVFSRLEWSRLLEPTEDFLLSLRRRGCGKEGVDLRRIGELWEELQRTAEGEKRKSLLEEVVTKALWVPNDTSPASMAIDGDDPLQIAVHGSPSSLKKAEEFQKFCERHDFLRNDNLGNIAYHRSYFTKGPLAELEDALVRYSLDAVRKAGFTLISVPDILFPHVIESCGMKTRSERDQIFWLELPDAPSKEAVLSGTAEMSIGGSLQDAVFEEEELPLRLAAVSRCFRAETSSVDEERGLFRVHEFTKVELFGVTANESGNESNGLHEEFRALQERLFGGLGLHFRTLEMPPGELGVPAFRKWDMEAWMPGRGMFGEISSTSNCTDFQSRRLNVRYRPKGGGAAKFAHTVNGTACAIPRMLISLIETCQREEGKAELPEVLREFMSRSWEESCAEFAKSSHKALFLRTKSSQEKYTSHFRDTEL